MTEFSQKQPTPRPSSSSDSASRPAVTAASLAVLGRHSVPATEADQVRVIRGANHRYFAIAGRDVAYVRSKIQQVFNIPKEAKAYVGGQMVTEDHIFQGGETLEFLKVFGEKGMGEVWTKEQFCALFQIGDGDFETMVAQGLPVYRMDDGSIRITETQADAFLDEIARKGSDTLDISSIRHVSLLLEVVGDIMRGVEALHNSLPDTDGPSPSSLQSPYLDIEQASDYRKKTPKALYGLIERGRLKKMPGSRVCYFTREMLDEYLMGETSRDRNLPPARRKKN